ncbi:MAG: phage integrase N-terminal SAM-like domain-containing protein [Candidatus Omnitrophota bacterium]
MYQNVTKIALHYLRMNLKFHSTRHPKEMGKHEIERFLAHLAIEGNIFKSTQNQAFNALRVKAFFFADNDYFCT